MRSTNAVDSASPLVRTFLLLSLTCLSLSPLAFAANSTTPSPLQYVLGRKLDSRGVNVVCLGASLSTAYAFLPPLAAAAPNASTNSSAQPTLNTNPANVTTAPATSANFLYVGNVLSLGSNDSLCACYTYNFLFNGSDFVWTGSDNLPGSASTFSYVSPVWGANDTDRISLTIANNVNEYWDIKTDSTLQPVLPPLTQASYNVSGTSFNDRLQSVDMLQSFTLALLANPCAVLDCPKGKSVYDGTTYAVMLMDESDGTTIYYFFYLQASTSRWCKAGTPNGSYAGPCAVGSAFEAKYDVSSVDFSALHCKYDPSTCAQQTPVYYYYNRRLLHVPSDGVDELGRGRRLLTSSSTTLAGATSSSTCKMTCKCYACASKCALCSKYCTTTTCM